MTPPEQLRDILADLAALRGKLPASVGHHLQRAGDAIEDALLNLRGRTAGDPRQFVRVIPAFKPNPELVIFNPPERRQYRGVIAGCIGKRVHDIRYNHAHDGQAYEHPFETPVRLYAVTGPQGSHDILLVSPGGLELWRDF